MNALVTVPTNAEVYRASTDAAGLCRDIVVKTAMNIQGRKYVKAEGWLAIAVAHGCIASADQVERVNDEGYSGFRAIGIIRRMSDGVEISRAEGFVGDDEGTWNKRPVYARRAMAQTRAVSRACRSAFAHVVVLIDANLSTTPAEEVPLGGFDDRDDAPHVQNPQRARAASPAPANGIRRLTSNRAKEVGLDKQIKDAIWGCTTGEELAAWRMDFDKHTAQCPLSWLDSIENDIILRAEQIAAEEHHGEMDREFAGIVG